MKSSNIEKGFVKLLYKRTENLPILVYTALEE